MHIDEVPLLMYKILSQSRGRSSPPNAKKAYAKKRVAHLNSSRARAYICAYVRLEPLAYCLQHLEERKVIKRNNGLSCLRNLSSQMSD